MKLRTIIRSLAAVVSLSFLLTGCNKDENPTITDNITMYGATMNGASEKPTSTTSSATGVTTVQLNELTKVFSYTVTYSGLNPTAGHFHRITANSTTGTGGVEVPFTSLTSPITGSFTLANQARIDSFKNGYYYSNLHTAVYGNGEIRGDVKKQ